MPTPRDHRKSFRRRILKPTRIRLKGRWCELHDICNDGIGVVIDETAPAFSIGERIDPIPLPLDSGAVALRGVVTHLSANGDRKICGIRFVFEGDEFEAALRFQRQCTTAKDPGGR